MDFGEREIERETDRDRERIRKRKSWQDYSNRWRVFVVFKISFLF